MGYNVDKAAEILLRTPGVLRSLLGGLPPEWAAANEGPGTWSPFDVVGHLVHGERTDWLVRTRIILGPSPDKRFEPFVRDAMLEVSRGKTLAELLDEFAVLRKENVAELRSLGLDERKLGMTGIHPEFGEVTLRQHLASWVAHDLSHIVQIARVLAKQYRTEVGPWIRYLSLLQ